MATWLSPKSSKKKDTRDIRDFIAVHGKIMKASSPVECSDGVSKPTKTKQMTLALVHCNGHKSSRAKEAPATQFSTGVRKKAAVVEVAERDYQEPPPTDPMKENVAPYRRKRPRNTSHPSKARKSKSQTETGRTRNLVKHPPKQAMAPLLVKKRSSDTTSCGQSPVSKRSKLVSQWHNPSTSCRVTKAQQKHTKCEGVPLRTNPKTVVDCKSLPMLHKDAPLQPLREDCNVKAVSSHSPMADTDSVESTSSLELFDESAASPGDVDLLLASSCFKNSDISCPLKGFGSPSDLSSGDHCNTDDLLAELSMYEKIL